jgi:CubicO group peptidase (beta-lactamase class C family)
MEDTGALPLVMQRVTSVTLMAICVGLIGIRALGHAEIPDRVPVGAPVEPALDGIAKEHTLDARTLERLVTRARASNTDALCVMKDGRIVLESYSEHAGARGPIEAMSATKSVVALAFGRLLASGRLDSLDAPVHRFYPEWNQGKKAAITIRHLLTQRSGLHCERVTTEIYRSPDFVQLALCADVVEEPGTVWRYNNMGVNLLAGVVQKASGTRMDTLVGAEIFAPMGITNWSWSLDKAGNPHAMSGLQVRAVDLAKVGQLMLDGGTWGGVGAEQRRILPESFVREATVHWEQLDPRRFEGTFEESVARGGQEHRQRYGLLWWPIVEIDQTFSERLLEEWKRKGAKDEVVAKFSVLKGLRGSELQRRMLEVAGGEQAWFAATIEAGLPDLDTIGEREVGYVARGDLGQYLVVLPAHRLIAVRMKIAPEDGEYDEKRFDYFRDFESLVRRLPK